MLAGTINEYNDDNTASSDSTFEYLNELMVEALNGSYDGGYSTGYTRGYNSGKSYACPVIGWNYFQSPPSSAMYYYATDSILNAVGCDNWVVCANIHVESRKTSSVLESKLNSGLVITSWGLGYGASERVRMHCDYDTNAVYYDVIVDVVDDSEVYVTINNNMRTDMDYNNSDNYPLVQVDLYAVGWEDSFDGVIDYSMGDGDDSESAWNPLSSSIVDIPT